MSEKNDFLDKMRDDFLNKGSMLVEHELETQVQEVIDVRKEYPLKNTEILSGEIITKDIPKAIKKKVIAHQENLRKIIYATAQYIEENRFDDIDKAIKDIDLSKLEVNKIQNLVNAQKKINYSFQTLDAGVEIFSRVNQNLLDKIKNNDFEANQDGKMKKTGAYLANAVLVFELTSFIIQHLNNFNLIGIDDVEAIEKSVLVDLENAEKDDEKLKKDAINASNIDIKDNILKAIEGRDEVREVVRKKWKSFNEKIKSIENGVGKSLQMVEELKLVRDNARNQLDTLQIIATIQALEKNLEVFEGLAFMKKIELSPLNAKEASDLLGLNL